MQVKIYNIASELARKEMQFTDKDKENQTRLHILLEKTNENIESVSRRVEKMIAMVKERNPEIELDSNLRETMLNLMEKKVLEGEITTMTQLYDSDNIVTLVENDAKNSLEFEEEISGMLTDSLATGKIFLTSQIISQMRNGNLSRKQLDNLDKIVENSETYKTRQVESLKNITSSSATDQEKEDAGGFLMLSKEHISDKDFEENKDDKNLRRGAIMRVATMAISGNKELMEKAIIRAAKYGLSSLIKEDGTIDLDKAYETFMECSKDKPQILERFKTKELFENEVRRIYKGKAKRGLEIFDFEARSIDANSSKEKILEIIKHNSERRKQESESIMKFVTALRNGRAQEAAEIMKVLSKDGDKDAKIAIEINIRKNITGNSQMKKALNEEYCKLYNRNTQGENNFKTNNSEIDR